MENSSPPLSQGTGANWQLLDEFRLPIGPDTEATVYTLLREILEPLNLHRDFQDRLLNSAQDAMLRALPSNVESPFEYLHLAVLVPSERDSQRNTWGFFRIEKVDSAEPDKDRPDYAVEFYLYLEG